MFSFIKLGGNHFHTALLKLSKEIGRLGDELLANFEGSFEKFNYTKCHIILGCKDHNMLWQVAVCFVPWNGLAIFQNV